MFRNRIGSFQNGSEGPTLRRRGRMRWLPVLLFIGYVGHYYLTHQEEVPLTGRKQLVDLNREQEMALGYQSYRQILNQSHVVPSGRQ